jgi:molybdopterin molybdotransferase
MLSVEEALERVLALVRPLPLERLPILDALDHALGEDIVAESDIPPFANSAMDGYAVQAGDLAGASRQNPVTLRVIGEVAAGRVSARPVEPGTAIRIMTGAPMPSGADAVVRFEDTDEGKRLEGKSDVGRLRQDIAIFVPCRPGSNVRAAGEDMRAGELALKAGDVLRAQEIGVLASLGHATVAVHRKPRVAVLATGDELLEVHEPLQPGKIRNSNEYSTSALVARYGGIPVRLGIARDTVEDLTAKIEAGIAQGVDLFLTSAGVSVGDYDVVKEVLNQMGQINFWQVRMKPGKPLAFGVIRGVPLVGLPGNPVSAMVSFEQFVRPALRVMEGQLARRKQVVDVLAAEPILNDSGRRQYIRAIVTQRDGAFWATTTGDQGSGILTSMIRANALLVISEDVTVIKKGDRVPAQMLDWAEIL